MLLNLLVAQAITSQTLLQDAWKQVSQADSLSLTFVRTSEEVPREFRVNYSFKKGGYIRAEDGNVIDVGNPKKAYTYDTKRKVYQVRKSLPPNFSFASMFDLDILNAGLPIIGDAKKMNWHKHDTLRVELDGRKAMTKETKLFVFVDAQSHLPVGISANLGSITQVHLYENMQINPNLPDSMFDFTPPKDWKEVTGTTGGWK